MDTKEKTPDAVRVERVAVSRKGWWRTALTWAFTLGIIVYIALKVDWDRTRDALARADWRFIALAVLITLVGNLFIGPDRWRLILARVGCPISLRQAIFVKVAGSPAKFVVPMKMGEFFRSFYVSRQFGYSLERCLSSVLMEKVATMLAAGLFLLAGLAVRGVHRWRWEALAVTAVLFLVFISRGGQRAVSRLLGRVSGGIARKFADIVSALGELSLASKALILLYSIVFVLTELFISYFSFRALGLRVPVVAFFVFTPLSILASIPTFSGIGAREAASMWFFSAAGLFPIAGATQEDLFVGGALITLIYYLFVPLAGLPWSRRFLERCIWKNTSPSQGEAAGRRAGG